MKKIINNPENYVDEMLKGIYEAHKEVTYANDDLRCYCVAEPVKDKVAIITGGGTGHLPLFLGYVGKNLLDGCGVGGVFQSPSPDQIFEICKKVNGGKGILFLYGNYSGDIMTFDMAAEMCDFADIKTRSIVGADDVNSAPVEHADRRRGIAGILFMYKCAGAKAALGGSLDEVYEAADMAKRNTRTVGFALTPCIIPEKGTSNFTLADNEMAFGMGIHGEPGIWNGPVKTSKEIAKESLDIILKDMQLKGGDTVEVLVNGLGASSIEELYIFSNDITQILTDKGVKIHKTYVGEYATSMEMAGSSISICKIESTEMQDLLDLPAETPFFRGL